MGEQNYLKPYLGKEEVASSDLLLTVDLFRGENRTNEPATTTTQNGRDLLSEVTAFLATNPPSSVREIALELCVRQQAVRSILLSRGDRFCRVPRPGRKDGWTLRTNASQRIPEGQTHA
jgi:hypothetical protein